MLHSPKRGIQIFTTQDALNIITITFLSFAIHFNCLHFPDKEIFDEVHFGNFLNGYSTGKYIYDIHPPAGKMIMYAFSNFSGYIANIDFDANFGMRYATADFLILRSSSAFFSSFCPALIYFSMRFSYFSKSASFLSSFLILMDTSMLTEHRCILSDGLLHFCVCLFLAVYCYTSSIPITVLKPVTLEILPAICLGLACSCKNTAWGLCFFCIYVEFIYFLQTFKKITGNIVIEFVARGFVLFTGFVLVHFVAFVIHLLLLPMASSYMNYIDAREKVQLFDENKLASTLQAKRLKFPFLLFRVAALFVCMHASNMGIKSFHPYQSRPINWPLLTGIYVGFFTANDIEVNCMGNVIVYYLAFAGVIVCLFSFKHSLYFFSLRWIVGWAVCYFPFFLIPRSMYLYHYQVPLIFGCMAAGAAIEMSFPSKIRPFIMLIFCTAAAFGFWLWSPYSYGTPHLPIKKTIWNEDWRFGDAYHRNLSKYSK